MRGGDGGRDMGGPMNLFDLDAVTYRFNRVVAVDGLSMAIPAGTRVGLLGANGSGKSTLLRLLDGLYLPDSGRVRFLGDELTGARLADETFALGFRRRVGLLFQNPDVQLFGATVFDEVAFGPLQLRLPAPEVRARVMDTLERLRLTHLKDRVPHRLSGGEKKRVALASVLVTDPEVLLLDEPTDALDPRSQSELIDLLMTWADGSKSVVTATHHLGILDEIADRCFVLDKGRLVAERTPAELLQDQDLLDRTNLIHVHRHRHSQVHVHTHPHTHGI
jgi:cobalt/nickel transport system ATP-binding protein